MQNLTPIICVNLCDLWGNPKIFPRKTGAQFPALSDKQIPVHGDAPHYPQNTEYSDTPETHTDQIN